MTHNTDTSKVYDWKGVPDKGLFEMRVPKSCIPAFREYVRGKHGQCTNAAALWCYHTRVVQAHPTLRELPDIPSGIEFRELDPQAFVFGLEWQVQHTDTGERRFEATWPDYVDTLEDHLRELEDACVFLGLCDIPGNRRPAGLELRKLSIPVHVRGMLVRRHAREFLLGIERTFHKPVGLSLVVYKDKGRELNKAEARRLIRELPTGWTPKGEGWNKRIEFSYKNANV